MILLRALFVSAISVMFSSVSAATTIGDADEIDANSSSVVFAAAETDLSSLQIFVSEI